MTGAAFEKAVEKILQKSGDYWVHNFAKAKDGSQPFDILALRDGLVYAYDCKVISGDTAKSFPLSRVEDNQIFAFNRLNEKANVAESGYLILFKGRILYADSFDVEKMEKQGARRVQLKGLREWKYQLEAK